MPIDYRAFKCLEVLVASVDDNMHQYVPYYFNLTEYLLSDDGSLLPSPLSISSEFLDQGAIFGLYDGSQVLIFVGSKVNVNLINDLFGSDFVQKGVRTGLPVSKAPISQKLRAFIDRLCSMHNVVYPLVTIIFETARERFLFTQRLMEDRGPNDMPSYVNFLQALRDRTSQ